jgi:hypothetical protein
MALLEERSPMEKKFALEPGGAKRLTVTYGWNLANAQVLLDGRKIASFATKADFQRGTTCKLPDASLLTVRFGSVEGAPLLKGVHVFRNGRPLSGSAADPVPKWAWVFIVACALIPIISVGGAVPVLLAMAGVSGTLAVARFRQWSAALRACACSLIVLACWIGFALLISALRPASAAKGWNPPFSKTLFMSSSPDKLMNEIAAAYSAKGYNEKAISRIKATLQGNCDRLEPKQCVAFLQTALLEIQNRQESH